MSFISGIIVGGLVGIGLILAFTYAERRRQKLRSELTKTVAAFARMTVQDSRKLLPSEAYPSWVVFSQRQKLDWLNQQLDKIWPYVNEAASELIRNNVESILEEHRPLFLASLKFSKLTLGTVAPQFTELKNKTAKKGNVGGRPKQLLVAKVNQTAMILRVGAVGKQEKLMVALTYRRRRAQRRRRQVMGMVPWRSVAQGNLVGGDDEDIYAEEDYRCFIGRTDNAMVAESIIGRRRRRVIQAGAAAALWYFGFWTKKGN